MGRYLELARKAERGLCGETTDTSAEPGPTPDGVDAILQMPLDEFGCRHQALKVRLPGGAAPHYFVSGPEEVAVLRNEGVSRGVIWTAKELASVLADGWTEAGIKTLIEAKRLFGGALIGGD